MSAKFYSRKVFQFDFCFFSVSYLICYHQAKPDRNVYESGTKDIQCLRACFTFNKTCFCRSDFQWTFQKNLNLTDQSCSSMSCIENYVLPYSDDSCVNPDHTTIFDLTSWIENDGGEQSFWENFVRISPNKGLVSNTVKFEFAYSEEHGNLFSFEIGRYSTVNQSKSVLIYQFTHSGNYTIQMYVSSQRFPSFVLETTLNVEYRIVSSELLKLVPSFFHGNGMNNKSIQVYGKFIGAKDQTDIYWNLFNNPALIQTIPG